MESWTVVVVAALGGMALGWAVASLTTAGRRPAVTADRRATATAHDVVSDEVATMLSVLRSAGIVLDSSDRVVTLSPAAASAGLVRAGSLVHPELVDLARQVRRSGGIRDVELDLPRVPLGSVGAVGRQAVRARVARLDGYHVVLLVEDRGEARRLEETRRDFVANVSHELKTPIGGIALLSEAIQQAKDDPEAVARFAARINGEANRVTGLVRDIVDLSRLESLDILKDPAIVDLSDVARDAVDMSQVAADAKGIEVVCVPAREAPVWGHRELLVVAVHNLVSNAIAYSDDDTRVTVKVGRSEGVLSVAVTDQGQGIPVEEQQRIFERFYRIDPARSRATGGTGLGLSIVKHVCVNHGGDVGVWSEVGRGSTFTIRLPAAEPAAPPTQPSQPGTLEVS